VSLVYIVRDDYEALDVFYRMEEGGETVLWRTNSKQRVEFFNISVSGRRGEVVFQGEERNKQRLFRNGKGAREAALISHAEG
jgi:hypothetical protein